MTETVPQAVEPPAPDANVPPEEVVADPSPAAVETSEAEKPKGVQKRLDELTRNWREAERREQALLRLLEQQRQAPEAPKATEPVPDKTLADFNYDEGQYRAYLREEVSRVAREEAAKELRAERERAEAERRKTSFTTRESDFAKSVEDYHEVTRNPRLPITEDIAEVIAESEDGPALAYYLGKNLQIAEAIARLPPKLAARELGKIEAKLAFEREKAKDKPVVSKAPPPPPKIEGANAAPTVRPDDPESDKALSDDEWARARKKQLAKRGLS